MTAKKYPFILKFKLNLPIFAAILGFIALSLPFLRLISFTDEYEQAVSGWFILNGLLPYRDFFSHHAPLTLFLSVLGFTLPGVNPVLALRVFFLVFEVLVWLFLFFNTNSKFRPVIFLLMFFSVIGMPIFALQMALPDTIVYYALLIILVLMVHRWLYGNPSMRLLAWTYVIVFLVCIWSTIAALLPLVCLGSVLCQIFWKSPNERKHRKALIAPVLFCLAGLIFFPLFYFVLGSFSDFWWSVFKFNTDYYYPLRLAQNNLDFKYGALFQVVWQFWSQLFQNFGNLVFKSWIAIQSLWGINKLVLSDKFFEIPKYLGIIFQEYARFFEPLQTLIFIGVGLVILYFLVVRKVSLALLFSILSMSMFFRINEIFHISPLFLVVVMVASIAIVTNWKSKPRVSIALPSIILILLTFNLISSYKSLLLNSDFYISDDMYVLGAVVKANSAPNDRMTVIGGNWIYYLLAHRLPACRYHYYLPWFEGTPQIRKEFKDCLSVGRAKLVLTLDNKLLGDVEPELEKNYMLLSTSENVFVRKN